MTGNNILLTRREQVVEHSTCKRYDGHSQAISELQSDNFVVSVTHRKGDKTFTYMEKTAHEAVVISDDKETKAIINRYPRVVR